MKLSTLRGREQKVLVEVQNEDGPPDNVEVIFKPGALTFDVIERIQDAAGTGGDAVLVAELLHTILVSWDLEEDLEDGSVRPMTTSIEDIRKVPLPFIGLVMDKITEEARGNPRRGETSEDGSPQAEGSERSLSGISS